MATTDAENIFIDTYVLVYAKLAATPLHVLAIQRLTTLQTLPNLTLWISRQILREYLATMTGPGIVVPGVPGVALVNDVRDCARRFHVADENRAVTDKLLALIEQKGVSGKQIHDANIVATMHAHGIDQLLTHNVADFARYSGLIRVSPLQI